MSIVTAYLVLLFCGLATYSMFLLNSFHNAMFAYGIALFNASVIAKVIIVGQTVRAGTMLERKALMYSALWKAAVFALLVLAFHVVEEMIRDVIRGEPAAAAFHDVRIQDLLVRTMLNFCAFIPLFIFVEIRRVVGDQQFWALLFHSALPSPSGSSQCPNTSSQPLPHSDGASSARSI